MLKEKRSGACKKNREDLVGESTNFLRISANDLGYIVKELHYGLKICTPSFSVGTLSWVLRTAVSSVTSSECERITPRRSISSRLIRHARLDKFLQSATTSSAAPELRLPLFSALSDVKLIAIPQLSEVPCSQTLSIFHSLLGTWPVWSLIYCDSGEYIALLPTGRKAKFSSSYNSLQMPTILLIKRPS